jgi:hypothetical protein
MTVILHITIMHLSSTMDDRMFEVGKAAPPAETDSHQEERP